MTTKEMVRCKKCSYCEQDEEGNWLCTECMDEIHNITDEECPLEGDNMDSKQIRCQDCIALVAGDNGEWICDECEKEIHAVEQCPEGLDEN